MHHFNAIFRILYIQSIVLDYSKLICMVIVVKKIPFFTIEIYCAYFSRFAREKTSQSAGFNSLNFFRKLDLKINNVKVLISYTYPDYIEVEKWTSLQISMETLEIETTELRKDNTVINIELEYLKKKISDLNNLIPNNTVVLNLYN